MADSVRVRKSARVNLGDYNWFDFEFEVVREVRPDETAPQALEKANKLVDEKLRQELEVRRRGS